MAFISVTRLRLRSWRFLPAFLFHTARANAQVKRAPGLLASSLLADRDLTYWTVTSWRDQSDMRRYMTSGAHLKAMPRLLHWCDEASIAHWTQESDTLPTWPEADQRMRAEGRPSKVLHPSPNHRNPGAGPLPYRGA